MDIVLNMRAIQMSLAVIPPPEESPPETPPTTELAVFVDTIIASVDGTYGDGWLAQLPVPEDLADIRQMAIDAAFDYWSVNFTIVGAMDGLGHVIEHS